MQARFLRYRSRTRAFKKLHVSSRSQQTSSLQVFDRDLKKRQKDFASQVSNSQEYDYLRDAVASNLHERLSLIKRDFPVVADLGANTGNLYKQLAKSPINGIKTFIQLEHSEKMLFRDVESHKNDSINFETQRIVADEERIPLNPESVDLVLSSMSLHWVNDLPGCFQQVRYCLKPDGCFLGAMLGGKTLQELRSAFVIANQERLGGIGNHISPFTSERDLGDLLNRAGFNLLTVDKETYSIPFPDMFTLIEHLRGMGETNCTFNRTKRVSRDIFLAAAAAYDTLYKEKDDRAYATFDVIFFIAWAPHQSQQKPLPRGAFEHSLKHLGEIDDIIDHK